jgi:sn-glycerol 3-phosphate transport system substrate-binding protein
MPRQNGVVINQLVDSFNASQTKVHVNVVAQTSYNDTWQKYQAGLSNGQLPDVVQLQDTDTQGAVDTQSIEPVQSCWSSFGYSTGDLLPRALAYWKIENVQQAMPFAVSGPVLYYNQLAFQNAGLNPATPPATLSQLQTTAQTLKSAGQGGLGLKVDPWYLETELATANKLFVNNSNGRTSRATASVFNNSTGVQVFNVLKQMVAAGTASTNSATGSDAYDNLLGVGTGKYSMTMDTSAALGTIQTLLAQYPNVKLGVAPLPTVQSTPTGGVEPGGSGLWISKKSSPAAQAAAWTFINFMTSSTSQATWSAGTGYIPLRTSSAQSSTIQNLWATTPEYKVAYTQLTSGIQSAATAGAVLGPYGSVRTALVAAENSMFVNGVSASSALSTAQSQSNKLITDYNQRLGVG